MTSNFKSCSYIFALAISVLPTHMSEVLGLSNESGLHAVSLKLQNKVSLDAKTPSKILQSFIQPRRLVRNLVFPLFSLSLGYIHIFNGWILVYQMYAYYLLFQYLKYTPVCVWRGLCLCVWERERERMLKRRQMIKGLRAFHCGLSCGILQLVLHFFLFFGSPFLIASENTTNTELKSPNCWVIKPDQTSQS